MAAEGMDVDPEDVLVTTGGQQVIDLVCKTLVDPGDVIVAEAPTYPGAVPAFSAYQADVVQIAMDDDGMRIDELEETLERLEREGRRPKFIYTIPTFQNPAGVTMSLPRRQRLVQVARERELLVLEDNPYGLLRYEGEALPTLRSLDGGDFVIYLGTFSKILSPGIRLGWTVAPAPVLEKMNLGKQASDLCSSSLSQLFVAPYFAEGHWQDYIATLRDLYRRRRDTMLDALAEHLPPEAAWTHPAGGLFIWATLPDYIDTTDLLARALSRNVAFVPGRAAYLDGRGGSSMRLNFSGVDDDAIREGVRRIGEVVREQVALYGTLTGAAPPPAAAEPAPRAVDPTWPTCCTSRAATIAASAGRDERRRDGAQSGTVAVLKGGRSLERQVSLRSGARVQDALERLGHEVVGIDVGHDLVARLREVAPDVAFVALHGRDGEDGIVQELLEVLGIPYTASGVVGLHALLGQGAWPSTRCATPGCRRPTSTPSPRPRSRSSAPATRSARSRSACASRSWSSRPTRAARWGSASRPRAADVPAAHRGGLLLLREGPARAPRARPRAGGLDPRRRGAADRRGGPARGGLLRLRRALHDRAHELRLPGRAAATSSPRAPRSSRSTSSACSAAAASPASTSCSRRAATSSTCSSPTSSRG